MVNVSAYSTANVSNTASVTVTTADAAALALSTSSPMATWQGQVLSINFEKGSSSSVTPAFQLGQAAGPTIAADDFTMLNVFTVSNLSTNDVCATVTVVSGTAPAILQSIIGRVGGTSVNLTATSKQFIAKNASMNVDFRWHPQTTTASSSGTFQLQVSGTKTTTGSCP
jgi:hypothetical protein